MATCGTQTATSAVEGDSVVDTTDCAGRVGGARPMSMTFVHSHSDGHSSGSEDGDSTKSGHRSMDELDQQTAFEVLGQKRERLKDGAFNFKSTLPFDPQPWHDLGGHGQKQQQQQQKQQQQQQTQHQEDEHQPQQLFGGSLSTTDDTVPQVAMNFKGAQDNGTDFTDVSVPQATTTNFSVPQATTTNFSVPVFRRSLSQKRKSEMSDLGPVLGEEADSLDFQYHHGNDFGDSYDDDEDDECFYSLNSLGRLSQPCTPTSPKSKRMEFTDPFHLYEVQQTPCVVLTVRVIQGRDITLGFRDIYDTPDPYVTLNLHTSPEGRKMTSVKNNNRNPVWDETFTFFVDFTQTNVLQLDLMESNWLSDLLVGTVYFDVSSIREMGVSQQETFTFTQNGMGQVDMEFLLQYDKDPTLRYSLSLSDAEKNFQEKRKQKVLEGMKRLLGDEGPMDLVETPNIAVIGSGGGFRAMTGYSGVFKALVQTGLLDCSMYAGGLSGSSWLLSTLYSHPKWPDLDMGEFLEEVKGSVDKSLLRFANLGTIVNYAGHMARKRRAGQPVSFTDIFGRMVGETLLKDRMDCTLTDQREKVKDGAVPLPLYTCVHVKKDVPARKFQEWVEFSPYEIGLPKYGTFLDTALFGSKFFMGKLVRKFDEQPLHFLQGIWGSAFCILFKRLLGDNRRIDPVQMIRQEMDKKLEEERRESSSDCSDDDTDDNDDSSFGSSFGSSTDDNSNSRDSQDRNLGSQERSADDTDANGGKGDGDDEGQEEEEEEEVDTSSEGNALAQRLSRSMSGSAKMLGENQKGMKKCSNEGGRGGQSKKSVNWGQCPTNWKPTGQQRRTAYARSSSAMRKSKARSSSYWKEFLKRVFESNSLELLTTRRGRAAVIHNFMRGLSIQQTYPMSPFTPLEERVKEGDEFDSMFEMHPTNVKRIYMVDAGLTFNSPYPLMLRPQREVDIILSFDFSARESDEHHPFKELLLAEKWASMNRIPFPPIDVSQFDKEGMKELYVFRHPTNPFCPVVLHFVLTNQSFRYYSKPGVPRKTKEESDFAKFDIFNDPSAPYSTFNFTYTHRSFERLSKLMEYNLLNHVDEVKEVIKDVTLKRRENPNRYSFSYRDLKLLRMQSVVMKKKLQKFINRMGKRNSCGTPSTPFMTPMPFSPSMANPFFPASPSKLPNGNPMAHTDADQADGSACQQGQAIPGSLKAQPRLSASSSVDGQYGTPPEYMDFFRHAQQPEMPADESGQEHQDALTPRNSPPADHGRDETTGPSPARQDLLFSSQESSAQQSPLPSQTAPARLGGFKGGVDSGRESGYSTASPSLTSPLSADFAPVQPPRKRRDTPPNPFFAKCSFLKSSLSSSSSSSSMSSKSSFSSDLSDLESRSRRTSREVFPGSAGKSGHNDSGGVLGNSQGKLAKDHAGAHQQEKTAEVAAPSLSPCTPASSPCAKRIKGSLDGDLCDGPYSSTESTGTVTEEQEQEPEAFLTAPAAFRMDGTPVFDQALAKMFYEGAKNKRKILRRQSTVGSMKNISLDDADDKEGADKAENGWRESLASGQPPSGPDKAGVMGHRGDSNFPQPIDVSDLSQFQPDVPEATAGTRCERKMSCDAYVR